MSNTKLNKNQAGSGIWTSDSLVAGTNISITQVPQPVIDANTLGVWHLDGNAFENAVSGSTITQGISTVNISDTTNYKFGPASARLVNNYSANILSGLSSIIGTGDFTLDFWYIYLGSNSSTTYFNISKAGFRFVNSGSNLAVQDANANSNLQSVSTGVWNHFAAVRRNGVVYYFINGIKQSFTITDTTSVSSLVNSNYSNTEERFDEIRLSNVARWTSDFTPYTVHYSASAGPAQYAINNTKPDPDLSAYLKNTATGSSSITIGGTASSGSGTVNVGSGSTAAGNSSTSCGYNAIANGQYTTSLGASSQAASGSSTAIGYGAQANASGDISIGFTATSYNGTNAIAIGYQSMASAQSAIQLGTGTNSTASTLQVFSTTLLNANGKVPLGTLPIVQCTQAEYDALVSGGTVDTNTLYIIVASAS